MFKGKKIKNLLLKLEAADSRQEESILLSEIEHFGKSAVNPVVEVLRARSLSSEKAEALFEKLCDDSCVEIIVPLIGDSYRELRRIAREMILKRWRRASTKFLLEYLAGPDVLFRTNAAELLASIKDSSVVPQLVSMFNAADADVKRSIMNVLAAIGGELSKKLILSALKDESYQVRKLAVKLMGTMKIPEALEPVVGMLKEEDVQIKSQAMDALIAIGDRRAIHSIMELIKDDDLMVRQKATECVIELGDSSIVPDVVRLMTEEDVNIRRCAVEVLNNLKDPQTGKVLMEAIKDSDWWVRQIAIDALVEMKGDKIIHGFIHMINDSDENIRRCAVEFFTQVSEQDAFDPLIECLKDEDWWVREKAVIALGRLKDKRAIGPLMGMIGDTEVMGAVPGALAEVGGSEVHDNLRKLLNQENKQVRLEAIKALGKLKAADAVSDLRNCLKDPEEDVRNQAAEILKQLTGKVFRPASPDQTEEQSSQISKPVPEGTTFSGTIVVIDLCNAADISARHGDGVVPKIIKKLTDTITPIAKKEQSRLVKSTGDGFLLLFPKVINAVRFSLNLLNKVNAHNTKTGTTDRICLRVAINMGEVWSDKQKDGPGTAIKIAFGVKGLKPEQLIPVDNGMAKEEMPTENRILVTESVQKALKRVNGIRIRPVGLSELKGVAGLHNIYILNAANKTKSESMS